MRLLLSPDIPFQTLVMTFDFSSIGFVYLDTSKDTLSAMSTPYLVHRQLGQLFPIYNYKKTGR